MKVFLNICGVIIPVLLLLSIFRKLNGVTEQLTITYMFNIFSSFHFDLTDTKQLIEMLVLNFQTRLDISNIVDISSFFTWLGSVFDLVIVYPINFIFSLLSDIGRILYQLFNIILELFGLSIA